MNNYTSSRSKVNPAKVFPVEQKQMVWRMDLQQARVLLKPQKKINHWSSNDIIETIINIYTTQKIWNVTFS